MTKHARAVAIAGALLTSMLVPVVAAPPAAAHTFTSRADTTSASDITVTAATCGGIPSVTDPCIAGKPMKVRLLRPTASAPAGGWPLVIYMAGDLKNRCANVNEVYANGSLVRSSWYSRKAMVEDGFAVLSFNARGYPANTYAGENPTSTSTTGCDTLADAKDAVDSDGGWDAAGAIDKGDVSALIEWAVANYNPNVGGNDCAAEPNPCVNPSQVGVFAYGAPALTALHMGVPASINPQFNSRVKGIVAVGYDELAMRNLHDLSDDGAGNVRMVDKGMRPWLGDADVGHGATHAHPEVARHTMELLRDEFRDETVPAATSGWFDDRTFVDDNASVDKAADATVPTFIVNSMLDPETYLGPSIVAYNKLTIAEKYLYQGACGSSYSQLSTATVGPCQGTNLTHLQDRAHQFLDRNVRADGTVLDGHVWWAVPPATNPLTSFPWTMNTSTTAISWPPADGTFGVVTQTFCLHNGATDVPATADWLDGACDTVDQNTDERTIVNTVGPDSLLDICKSATYNSIAPFDSASYTTVPATGDGKMLLYEADVSLKSTSSRAQVYADLFTVNPSGTETRIWQGDSQIMPVKRNGSAGTVYRFQFIPAGTAYTLKNGDRLRLKLATRPRVAAPFASSAAADLIPADFTILHTDAQPTQFKIVWDT